MGAGVPAEGGAANAPAARKPAKKNTENLINKTMTMHEVSIDSVDEKINLATMMNIGQISSKFKCMDRFSAWCTRACSCGRETDRAKNMLENQEPMFKFHAEYKEDPITKINVYNNYAVKLKVKETGSMAIDPNLLHPFVKVHIIDLRTGMYLRKSNAAIPAIYNKESAMVYNWDSSFKKIKADFLMPMATQQFDMRKKGQS